MKYVLKPPPRIVAELGDQGKGKDLYKSGISRLQSETNGNKQRFPHKNHVTIVSTYERNCAKNELNDRCIRKRFHTRQRDSLPGEAVAVGCDWNPNPDDMTLPVGPLPPNDDDDPKPAVVFAVLNLSAACPPNNAANQTTLKLSLCF